MSKKHLSRTTIEGGRTTRNTWERRHSHESFRASEREYCHRAEIDSDSIYEDRSFVKNKEHVRKDFSDKLSPMYRWLHSKVGKIWNDVRSEISKKFDSRTTAGRHILYDHLLSSVEEVPDLTYHGVYNPYKEEYFTSSSHFNSFYVDSNGLLQNKTYLPRRHSKTPKFNTSSITNWLGCRVVGKIGNKLFWFVPVTGNAKRGVYDENKWKSEWAQRAYSSNSLIFLYSYQEPIYEKNKEGIVEKVGSKQVWRPSTPNFRQDRKLNDKEMVFWNSMPEFYQKKILERSPTYPENLKPKILNPYYYY